MMTKDIIKEIFLFETIEYGKAIAIGDHKKANKLHKKIHALYNNAKKSGQTELFGELLSESDENVRLWAAIFTLKVSPEVAEKVLKDLTKLPTITAMSAEMSLDLWKKGMLHLL